MNRGEEEGAELDGSEHRAYATKEEGHKSGAASSLNQDAAPFRFGYSAVASLGASEEWAFRLSSATRRASSSKLDSWAMFHT